MTERSHHWPGPAVQGQFFAAGVTAALVAIAAGAAAPFCAASWLPNPGVVTAIGGLTLLAGVVMLVALVIRLLAHTRRVATANTELEAMLRTDALTGLDNRRAFESALDTEWRRARREETAVSLLMIDIDLFKGFNDRYGHPAGDACLRRVATAIDRQIKRPGDLAARIGGEEFVILLPGTDEPGASRVAERVRQAVQSLGLPHEDSHTGCVTISVGYATRRPRNRYDERHDDPAAFVQAADTALYRAKKAGRDQVCAEPACAALTMA